MPPIQQQAWEVLTDGTPVVVTSHRRLDGDGLGAALALWHGLRGAGVRCHQHFEDPIPELFRFLPGLQQRASTAEQLPERFHLAVIDSGHLERIGPLSGQLHRVERLINIDHHLTNTGFGDLNYVCREASCSGELVYNILRQGGVPLTAEVGQCLYTAVMTDTGSFTYGNTTRAAFEIGARLVETGVRPWELAERIYLSAPEKVLRLRGEAIRTLRLEQDGRLATMEITRQMFRRTDTCSTDTQGFADIPISVQGVSASALLKEISSDGELDYIKVSMRSRPSLNEVNVCAVAEAFGGGGHRHAAGCELEGPLARARQRVLDRLRRELEP